MDSSWWTDYCLACGKQTDGAAYCSQSCRLADIDKSSSFSEPSSPTSSQPPLLQTIPPRARSGFYLPPAINFASYRTTPSAQARPPQRNTAQVIAPAYDGFFDFSSTDPSRESSATGLGISRSSTLAPSSSHSSLVSIQSTSSHETSLSEQARTELKDYASSFDQVRDLKRRMTSHQADLIITNIT